MNLASTIRIYAGGVGSGCHGPNCGRPPGKVGLEEGDRVVMLKPVKSWSEQDSNKKTYPVGTEAMIYNVLPKIGTAEQMVAIRIKGARPEHVPMRDVMLLEKGDKTKIDVKPVSKSKIVQQFDIGKGVKYTIIRPEEEKQSRGPQDPTKKEHGLKGDFDRPEKQYGAAEVRKGQSLKTWTTEAQDKDTGRGATVFVHKYADSSGKPTAVVIQEHNWVGNHERVGTPYQFEYKNAGKAMGLMKSRYGISIGLKDWRS